MCALLIRVCFLRAWIIQFRPFLFLGVCWLLSLANLNCEPSWIRWLFSRCWWSQLWLVRHHNTARFRLSRLSLLGIAHRQVLRGLPQLRLLPLGLQLPHLGKLQLLTLVVPLPNPIYLSLPKSSDNGNDSFPTCRGWRDRMVLPVCFCYNSSFANKFINPLVYQIGAPGAPGAPGSAGGSAGGSGGYGKHKINTTTSLITLQSEILLINCVLCYRWLWICTCSSTADHRRPPWPTRTPW